MSAWCRVIWKGAISFGMVVIPVKLYAGTENHNIRFVQLHRTCHNGTRRSGSVPTTGLREKADPSSARFTFWRKSFVHFKWPR